MEVPYIHIDSSEHTNASPWSVMDSLGRQEMKHDPWSALPRSCSAQFAVAHAGSELFIKFYVNEPGLRAFTREINGEVHRDNCVEMFIAFGEDPAYYNVEFNCLGTGKVAYGTGRSERKLVSPEIIKQIETKIKLQADNQGVIWEILLKVPLRTFCFHDIETLEGQSCRANFYKCGDDLEIPHYLSWQKIETPKPDFHQPKFFGELDFQP